MHSENYSRRKEKCHSIINLAWILLRLVTGVAGVWELQSLLGAAASAF
jgi:cytoskeletal protein RodZ